MDASACVLFVLFLISHGNGELSTAFSHQEAVVGEGVRLSCSTTDNKTVIWKHTPVGSQVANDVYVSGNVVKPYDKRFKVEQDYMTGDYILIVSSVQRTDSGTYVCTRTTEDSQKYKTELIVLDSRPTCEAHEVVGENDCDIKKEDFRLTCTVGFSGSVPPAMECSNLEMGKLENWGTVSNTVYDDRAVYSFVAKTSFMMNRKLLLCRTSLAHIPANSVKASVEYVFDTSSRYTIASRDSFNCHANSSQPCSYFWSLSSLNTHVPGQTIDIRTPGTYQCFAKCPINGTLCVVRPLLIRFEPEEEEEEEQPLDVQPPPMHISKKVVIIIVCVVAGIIVVSSIGIAFACAYRMLLSSSDPCPTIRFLWKISTDGPMVSGVAILRDSLYIVHRGQKEIVVYQATSPCRFLGKITLEGLQDPRDVAVCTKNSCLYISDSGHDCVWKVEVGPVISNKDAKISAWVAKVGEPYTLAVISGGRVLVVQKPNTLRIYRPDGTTFRTFQIKGNIGEPQHAVRTSKGTFIVSHGDKYDKEHRVCEVSAKGKILRSFGNRRGDSDAPCKDTELIRMSHPRHLAIDRSGRVLVVDRKNERIIRLDRKLCLIDVLRCPGSIDGPVRLFCEAGRFLIGRGDAIYVHSIDYDDNQSAEAVAPEKDPEESDSDDNTDDVKPLLRDKSSQSLLENQFTRQMQTFSPNADDSDHDGTTQLRHRKLENQ